MMIRVWHVSDGLRGLLNDSSICGGVPFTVLAPVAPCPLVHVMWVQCEITPPNPDPKLSDCACDMTCALVRIPSVDGDKITNAERRF